MPKIIQPKRLNKNITVDEYWQIRNKLKAPKKSQPTQAFRQEQVANRFRYLKPTEQAKLFNPLNYFFKTSVKQQNDEQQYAQHFKDQQFTFTHEYLSSLRYRVSGPLIPIKKLVFGKKSIIYNHEAILSRVVSNLQCDESFPLIQAIIKDTKQQSFQFWMNEGLQKLAYQKQDQNGNQTSIYSNYFNQTKFQNLFETLSIFMEANYEKIMQNLQDFFKLMNKLFFNHQNKYIRKFSMKSVSYIINNLSLQDNLKLIFNIVLGGSISDQTQQIPIGQLLLNRHKAVKGCLSSVQINNIIQTLKQLPLFMVKNFTQSQMIEQSSFKEQQHDEFKKQLKKQVDSILYVYMAGILDLLETKFGRAEENEATSQILFDLNYCIKAFVAVQQKSQQRISELTLIKAFNHYLQNCDEKRFLTHNFKHQSYINETFQLILTYLQNSTVKMIQTEKFPSQQISSQVSKLVGLSFKLCPKQSVKALLSKGIIHFCKQLNQIQALTLVQNIHGSQIIDSFDSLECKTLGQFLLISFSKFIKNFFESIQNNSSNIQLLYTIYMILKRINFKNTINLTYLSLDKNLLIKKVQSINQISEFFVFSKLATLLNLDSENNKQFSNQIISKIKTVFQLLILPFSQSLQTIINTDHQTNQNSIFSYNNHIKNLLRYSHHQVQWVNIAYNLEECCKLLMKSVSIDDKIKIDREKWIWSDLSLNRIIQIDQKKDLASIFDTCLNLLQSRNRMARKSILERILLLWIQNENPLLKTIVQRIHIIDSDDIDIDNQRDIKKEFVALQHQVSQIKNQDALSQNVIKLISNWILGFSFTGFKLVNDSIVSFTNHVFDLFSSEVSEIIFPFISYYIYRHSRQFQYDTTINEVFVLRTPKIVQNQLAQIKENQKFYNLVKEDFNIQNQNTIQWIGLQRIAQAIQRSRKFKNKNLLVKLKLQEYLTQYFNQQFFRKSKVLSSHKVGQQTPNNHLILQPKSRFLAVILKLCPETYLPPYECLHYLSPQYLNLQSVQNIKKNRWQALWVKKLKGSRSKQEISDTVNTTIALQKMSIEEQNLYAHFLWKQLIEANQQKRRSIIEHIRDRISDIIPYMLNNILYKQMLFVTEPEKYFEQVQYNETLLVELKQKLSFGNKKTLLNMMYLLKAIVVVFKNFLRNSVHMANIVIILRCIVQLVYQKSPKADDQVEEIENIEEQQQIQQSQNEQNHHQQQQKDEQKDSYTLYKPHRKELYKVLTEVFTHYSLQYQQAESILSDLSRSYLQINEQNNELKAQKIFAKIAYASVNSVPGILILLKVISQQHFYHHLLVKFGILDLIASIIEINDHESNNQGSKAIELNQNKKKSQSNPHAINTCLDILSNLLGITDQKNNNKMQEQLQNYLQTNWSKWTPSLATLLTSINHYFLHSHNLAQKTGNRSSYVELQYYTHQNKQNINSIQNNKNRNKKDHDKQLSQGRNLDIMWHIVGQIIGLSQRNQEKIVDQSSQNQNIILGNDWQQIFWSQINKLIKMKQFRQKQYTKLFKIIQIALVYFNQQMSNTSTFSQKLNIEQFLCKIISVLPHITQLSQRIKLTNIIHKGISESSNLKIIDQQAITTVKSINAVKKNGLNVQIDYDLFFGAISKYCDENIHFKQNSQNINQNKPQLNLLSHQYIIYNLLPYLTSQQLSVRKAVRQALNSFLVRISVHLKQSQNQTLKVYNSILRLLIEQLKRSEIDNVFWSILGSIGLFVRFLVKFLDKFQKIFENTQLYNKLLSPLIKISQDSKQPLTFQSQSQEDFFHMISSISQGNKMKALRMLKDQTVNLQGQNITQLFKQQEVGCCLPHPLPFLLSTLQHLVLPIKHFSNQHQYNVQGNLTSTLTHISLQIYETIIPFARESLIKKELKKLAAKIKFNDQQKSNQQNLKLNILLIKIISSIVEGIDTLSKCTGNIKKYVKQNGFDEFHTKLIQTARTLNQQTNDDQNESQQEQQQKKKIEFGTNLEQLQPEEAINRNFMLFDRKLMALQQKQNQQKQPPQSQSNSLVHFLKLHILIPLKLMLFYENKSIKQAKQEEDKSRMMISVAITKMLIKFPMEMFLFEFQKILSKICRLMKKRQLQVRQNGRKSLCQIAKIVGPQMLYAIVLELKFHLRDNFQKHIFNFTVFEIIQTLSPLKHGQIDYCLPLILPMIIDEIFGQSSQQKKMVQANEVPVLNMQTKKKKGNELLILISKQISVDRIRYLIEYLEKFLKQFLNSQTNLSKYDTVVNNLTNGLGQNEQFIDQQNSGVFGQVLADSMYELRKQIKIYNFEEEKDKIVHDTTIKVNNQKSKKKGRQGLLLQQQAGRNGSIFKKMSRQVYQKRNKQIMINCLVQFYLALGSLLIKKQVISIKTLQCNKHLTENFIKIMQFVFECMDHRDNRIVCKSMRLLHQALIMNYEKSTSQELKESTKSLRKKVSRKILLFIQKLTSSDAQLLKESFTILIDLFTHVTITKQFLPSILTIIKLHTNNQTDEANIPEPYRLLKLIIYKLPESIYDHLIYDMYQMIRINIVNCNNGQIRDVCKSIAMTYVRRKQFLITGIQLNTDKKDKNSNNPKAKHQPHSIKNVEHQYSQKIKKQLNFYLSNLDCKRQQNQLLVLQILNEWVQNRTKQQTQQVSQLILLSLATSLINGNQCIDKINKIMNDILKVIDKSKIYEVLEKTLVWIAQSREKAMIRQCGYLLLNVILQSKTIDINNQTVKNQYLLKDNTNNILQSLQTLLNEEVNILSDYLVAKKTENSPKKIQNKQWNSVLDAIEFQDANPYITDNKILEYGIDVLSSLAESTFYQQKMKQRHLISKVWKLLKIPKIRVCEKGIKFCQKINNLAIHLTSESQTQNIKQKIKEQDETKNLQFNLKSTIAALINNQNSKQIILNLIKKFNAQTVGQQSYMEIFDLLSSFMNKLVMKFKFMEPKAQTIYYLLNNGVIKNKQKRQLIFKDQETQNKIIDALGKVSRNQFVSLQVKTLNDESINLVKDIVGVSEFFKKLTKLQSQRRQKKSQQKAHLARLAVTDQKAYMDAKKKKVKTE